jgi:predicted PurR-regulated permease PerM
VKYLLGTLGVILLGLGIWYFQNVVAWIAISAVVSLIGGPLVSLLLKIKIGKWEMPRTAAAVITLAAFLLLIFAFFSIFAPLIAEEATALSKIDVNKLTTNLEEQFQDVMEYLAPYNLSGDDRSNEEYIVAQVKDLISFGNIRGLFNNIFGLIGNVLFTLFSVLFIAFFFLRDRDMLRRAILAATPDSKTEQMRNVISRTRHLLTRYFGGLLVQVTLITILISTGLSIFGVENAFLIGFLAGIINLIPYLGPYIGAVIAILITLTTNLDLDFQQELLPLILKIAGTFVVAQLIDNFFIQPVIFGNSVKAHPLEIFIVIAMAGTLAGVGGMILAIPSYTLIRIIAREFLSGFKVIRSLTDSLDEED